MYVLSFKNINARESSLRYYIPLAEMKDFNVLFDNKPFFDQPVKNKQEAYKKLIEMSRNDGYTKGNLLDHLYHQNYYKLVGVALSRQKNMSIPQQIKFVVKLEEDEGGVMFLMLKSSKKKILNFSLNSLIVTE